MVYDWSNKNILVVEDNQLNRYIIKSFLSSTKANLFCAVNSKEFFRKIEEYTFDLVLMDVNLGEVITGVDLVRYMQANRINTPIIIQTAYSQGDYDFTGIKFNTFINKPINKEELYKTIELIFNPEF